MKLRVKTETVCVLLQFLCLKNIRVFLHSCKDVFGLKEPELFDPYDLFDIRDFEKVYLPNFFLLNVEKC